MTRFLLKRLLWTVLTLWVVFTISFGLMKIVPGSPFQADRQMAPEVQRNIEAKYDLDDEWYEQYGSLLWDYLHLDFRDSFKMADYSVGEVIAEGFPISASLGILSMVFALTGGLTAGVLTALYRGKGLDVFVMLLATIGIAVPNFVLASLLIVVCVFWMHLFPAAGWGTPLQMILPAFCLGAPFAAYIARLTRTSMLEVLGQDYVRTARAKGLPPWRVITRHSLRGALLPVVSYLGPATAGILTGSLVLEKIFALPGLGTHFVQAALDRDYTLAMGMIMVYTLLLTSMNLLVDLSYSILDPRVKLK